MGIKAAVLLIFISSSSIYHISVNALLTNTWKNGKEGESNMSSKDVDCSYFQDGKKLPSPTSCSEFYVCDNGVAYSFKCPMMNPSGRLYFDHILQVCNWPNKVDCEETRKGATEVERAIGLSIDLETNEDISSK